MNTKLIFWLVAAMLRWTLPEAQHAAERERYEEIAKDAVAVAFDESEKPLVTGPLGRTRTATLLLAIASFESDFVREVDSGEKRGDNGRSWCIAQINLGKNRVRLEGDAWVWAKAGEPGWSGEDLVQDRKKCLRTALHFARVSYRACHDLSLYTSGRCSKTEPKARHRAYRARSWLVRHPVDFVDADVHPSDALAVLR